MDAAIILDYVIKSLNALLQVLAADTAATAQLMQLKSELETFIAENRDPTPAEWDALNARIDAKLGTLRG
jgi:hypothetical protein